MIKKMSLSQYFKKVFSIIVGIVGAVSLICLFVVIFTMVNVTKITDKLNQADAGVQEIRVLTEIVGKNLYKVLLTDDEDVREESLAFINDSIEGIGEQTQNVDSVYDLDEATKQEFQAAFANWTAAINGALELEDEGLWEEGFDYTIENVVPAVKQNEAIINKVLEQVDGEREDISLLIKILGIIATVLLVGMIADTVFMAILITKRVTGGVMEAVDEIGRAANELSQGHLDTHIDYEANNEFGTLAGTLNESFEELGKYVQTISDTMNALASNDLSIMTDETQFRGDFKEIATGINGFLESISSTLSEGKRVSFQAGEGAEQIAGASQNVAEGASDQSAGVEELSATVNELSEKVRNTAETIHGINTLMLETRDTVEDGNNKMGDMKDAMKAIADKSEEIRAIADKINEITAQTNLLSLNASIEAARAGEAGKGFAVVANEVSALAAQSASASKEIGNLIDETIAAVDIGTQKVDETAEVLSVIVEKTEEITEGIEQVASVTDVQAEGMQQLTQGIEMIANVVENNSAASQELAASAGTLTSNSKALDELMAQFKIREN